VTEDLAPILEALKQRLREIYGNRLVRVVLFGSRARGTAAPASDIDILIVLSDSVDPGVEIERTGESTAALSLEHNVVISCSFVSSQRFDSERSPLLINVHREGVSL